MKTIFVRTIFDKVEKHINGDYSHLEKALCSISRNFQSLVVESQVKNSKVLYKRHCENKRWSNIECVGTRSTPGTTVSFSECFSVKAKDTATCLTTEIKKLIESFYLLHSHISFSLRTDPCQLPCLQTKKMKNTVHAAQQLFKVEKTDNIFPFRGLSKHFRVKGLIVIQQLGESNWFIYVNSRLVQSMDITDLIASVLSKMSSVAPGQRLAVVLNIKVGLHVTEI